MKFKPTSLADFAFSHPHTREVLQDILDGYLDFPGETRGIMFYGAPGTGKSELARFLPELFDDSPYPATRGAGWGTIWTAVHETTCTAGMQPLALFDELRERRKNSAAYSPKKGLHYELYDEIDKLTPNTRDSLKGLMTNPAFNDTVFIFTTNNPTLMGSAMESRVFPLPMNHCSPAQLLPLGWRALKEIGVTTELTDADVLAIAARTTGDLRKFLPELRRVGRKALAGLPYV